MDPADQPRGSQSRWLSEFWVPHRSELVRIAANLLTDPEVAVVAIMTPPSSHAAIARAALEAGRHVFCEKPLATDPSAAADVLAAVGPELAGGPLDGLLPRVTGRATLDGERVLVETRLPGRVSQDSAVTPVALTAITALHRATASSVRVGPALLDAWVDQPLVAGLDLAQRVGDAFVDVGHGVVDALAAVTLGVAVAQLHRLEGAGGGARGHRGPRQDAVLKQHLDLDGRVAARVQDLPGGDVLDACHCSYSFIRVLGVPARRCASTVLTINRGANPPSA